MALSFVKTGVIALAMVAATATAASAATWAQVDVDSVIRANHNAFSPIVNSVDEGDIVKITGSWGQWYKIKIPGPDGWIRKNRVDVLGSSPTPPPPSGEFCVSGPLGYFCVTP